MSNNEPLVSVCIPVYNGEEHIAETIESVINQSYTNLEIIVLDNCSKDNTSEVISKYASLDERVHLFSNAITVDMGENWNLCIEHATGQYVMLLSADDLLMGEFVSRAIQSFRAYDFDVFSANHYLFNNSMQRQRRIKIAEKKYQNFTCLVLLKNPFSINFSLFSRKAITELQSLNKGKLFKNYYTCDYDLWIRASNQLSIYFTSEKLGRYRLHDNNLSNDKMRMILETEQVLDDNHLFLTKTCFIAYYLTKLRLFIRRFI